MDILYSCFAGQAKSLPFSHLHRLPIGGSSSSSSDLVFIQCCPFNQDGQIYPIPSAIAIGESHNSVFVIPF